MITSNANLMEFSTAALYDYLALVRDKLDDDGIFFVQCFGYGGGVGRTIDTLWDALYAFKLAPLFIVSDSHIDVSTLLQAIPSDVKRIALMPAGFTVRQLVSSQQFRERFTSITLVDRHKSGDFNGVRVVTPEELADEAVDLALILHKDREIVGSYRTLCEVHGIPFRTLQALDCDRSFAVPYGLFVGEHHPLFTAHYQRHHYEQGGVIQSDSGVEKVFFTESEGKEHYQKEELFRLVKAVLRSGQ